MNQSRGFSLIELMIVVVIIAILAAVAYPSYQQYVRESRRTDAKDALTRIASAQERYFFTHNSYTADLADLGMSTTSSEGFYTLAITGSDGGADTECGNADPFPCFRVTATATGVQATDVACAQLRITQTGSKTALDNANADNTAECW